MKTIAINCFTILLLFAPLSGINAQVTIGSKEAPMEGAILDLKTDPSGTSNKGLMLPRVMLEDYEKLQPMYSYKGTDTPSKAEELSHIGLMVYNGTKQQKNPCDFTVGKLQEGVFVWSGTEWVDVSNPKDENINQDKIKLNVRNKNVKIFYDKRDPNNPEPYTCRRFGKPDGTGMQAGVWMTMNLRATMYDPEYLPNWPSNQIKKVDNNKETSQDGLFYMAPYPYDKIKDPSKPEGAPNNKEPNKGFDDYWVKENPIAGYIYNYKTVVHGTTPGPQIVVQGLCPKGWHVPSLVEYQDLKIAIYEDVTEYLYDDDGAYPTGLAQNYTNALIVPCTPYGESVGPGGGGTFGRTVLGRSKSYSDGGFGDFGLGLTMMTNQPLSYPKEQHLFVYDNKEKRKDLGTDAEKPRFISLKSKSPNSEEKEDTFYQNSNPNKKYTPMVNLRCKKDTDDFIFD